MRDIEIREPFFLYLEKKGGKMRIIEEITSRKCRADAVVVKENILVGYEIKSDSDSYARLPNQVKHYNKAFDFNYLVIGAKHKKSAPKHIPDFWGIICVSEDGDSIEVVRDAGVNKFVKLQRQLEFLYRRELWAILDANSLPKYRNKSRKFMREKLLLKLDHSLLKEQMCNQLFEREYDIDDLEF